MTGFAEIGSDSAEEEMKRKWEEEEEIKPCNVGFTMVVTQT